MGPAVAAAWVVIVLGAIWVLGPLRMLPMAAAFLVTMALAVAAFAEAGKIWAGDSPFGVNTPVYASAGVSLLAASPPQSRRTVRVDFAFPVRGQRTRRMEVRIVVTDFTRTFRLEPRDVTNSRERSVPATVFSWP